MGDDGGFERARAARVGLARAGDVGDGGRRAGASERARGVHGVLRGLAEFAHAVDVRADDSTF